MRKPKHHFCMYILKILSMTIAKKNVTFSNATPNPLLTLRTITAKSTLSSIEKTIHYNPCRGPISIN